MLVQTGKLKIMFMKLLPWSTKHFGLQLSAIMLALEGVMTPTIIIPHYQIGQVKNVRGRVNTQVCVQWHLLSNAFNCRDNRTIRSTQWEYALKEGFSNKHEQVGIKT